jgi:hypothetical protein
MKNNVNATYSRRGTSEVTECRICSSKELHNFLSFGPIPLANSYLKEEQLAEPEPYYPLSICFCSKCGLVQLGQVVAPEVMFSDYAYLTGTSTPMKIHFASLAESVIRKLGLPEASLVVDIGSNDGTLLEAFKDRNMKVLGIEPAKNVADLAVSHGIETINNWFTEYLAEEICSQRGYPSVILATNVFAHVHDIKGFVSGVNRLMDNDSVFIIEVPYLVDMLNKTEFDTIYHEHLSYFAVCPLITLFEMFDMGIVDIERINTHGGSLRIYIKRGMKSSSQNVIKMRDSEISLNLRSLEPYDLFARKTRKIREELTHLLIDLKTKGSIISGYGASAKSSILLNYCQIGTETLDYVSDTTALKQGRYTPGTHIPIYSEEYFHKSPPDYALLLAWNYADDILKKEQRYQDAGGKFIVPMPKPHIV